MIRNYDNIGPGKIELAPDIVWFLVQQWNYLELSFQISDESLPSWVKMNN